MIRPLQFCPSSQFLVPDGAVGPPRDIWLYLEIFLVSQPDGGLMVLLAAARWLPGVPINLLLYTEQPHNNFLFQNVNSALVEEPGCGPVGMVCLRQDHLPPSGGLHLLR